MSWAIALLFLSGLLYCNEVHSTTKGWDMKYYVFSCSAQLNLPPMHIAQQLSAERDRNENTAPKQNERNDGQVRESRDSSDKERIRVKHAMATGKAV